jgi:anti-sigma factor RsiW
MSGRVFTLSKSAHREAQELLPWLANGTLDDAERHAVEQHLQGCEQCRRELQWLQQVGAAYAETAAAPDAGPALARLRGRLDEPAGSDRWPLRRPWQRAGAAVLGRGRWIGFALAGQLGVIVALGWVLAVREPPAGTAAAYRTLSAPGSVDAGAAAGAARLIVVFDPELRERDMRRIVRDAGARIVGGPSASNGYVLAVAPGAADSALEKLRSDHGVVLAESLQAGPSP